MEKEKVSKVEELKEMNGLLKDTNQHDVEIEKARAEVDKLKANLGYEFRKLELEKEHETRRFNTIVKSTETVLLGGMVLAGYVVATNKRHEANKYAVEYGATVE